MPVDSVSRQNHDDLHDPYMLDSSIPRHVSRVIMEGMNLNGRDRIQTITELVTKLFEQPAEETEEEEEFDSTLFLNDRPAARPPMEEEPSAPAYHAVKPVQPLPETEVIHQRTSPVYKKPNRDTSYSYEKVNTVDRIKVPIIIGSTPARSHNTPRAARKSKFDDMSVDDLLHALEEEKQHTEDDAVIADDTPPSVWEFAPPSDDIPAEEEEVPNIRHCQQRTALTYEVLGNTDKHITRRSCERSRPRSGSQQRKDSCRLSRRAGKGADVTGYPPQRRKELRYHSPYRMGSP